MPPGLFREDENRIKAAVKATCRPAASHSGCNGALVSRKIRAVVNRA